MEKQSDKKYSVKYFTRRLKTPLKWDDLVLPEHTLEQVRELEAWLQHGDALLGDWGMRGKVKPGFRALFHGPSGTGKTLAASLLGKSTGRNVFRVDLSAIVSKYIGETEKNLNRVFSKAEKKNWILFFDEADALFGKRTEVKDSHDRYANQAVACLLSRLDTCTGLAILATNLPENIDDVFVRRFQAVIAFPVPDAVARLTLWENAFPRKTRLASDVDLKRLAENYALDPAAIMSVVQYCCLCAMARGTNVIGLDDVEAGVRRELQKSGKVT